MGKNFLWVLLLLLGCSTAPKLKSQDQKKFTPTSQAERDRHLGYWVGEMTTKDGKFLRWLVERRKDGTYTLTHILRDSPQDSKKFDPARAFFELGIWGISGDVYFTATRQYFENGKINQYDVTDASLYDAYRIRSFDGTTFSYQNVETGDVFTVKKVPQGSKLEI